ncbi:MAG: pseudouridine synthase [Leptolyngbya sp. PLA3]|nr:MAG: pseudouridine synthase [Cyanobacteria bacterium CYA]MCE7969842.1 pseudouridine synthase [Leptolyngbya sp. PL-A3]
MPRPKKGSSSRPPKQGERLQRVLADAGVASRRECERLIESGAVEVNGEVVTRLPVFVDPENDRIMVEGRPIRRQRERKLYILLNKPSRTLTTNADEPGSDRRTVIDLVDHPQKSRLFPVGRLDYDTTGLLLLTNDGDLANQLTHPRYGVPKTYRAVVKGTIEDDAVAELERGIFLADRKAGRTQGASRTAHVEVRVVLRERERTTLELTLREGRNRQVRRLLAAVGYPVKRLERIAMGPLSLRGVARGQWRELDRHEIRALKKASAAPVEPEAPARTRRPADARPETPSRPSTPINRSVAALPGARSPGPCAPGQRSASDRGHKSARPAQGRPGSRSSRSKPDAQPQARPARRPRKPGSRP